jgi:hypothetical protein
LTGLGQFRGASGVAVQERSMLLILRYPDEARRDRSRKIEVQKIDGLGIAFKEAVDALAPLCVYSIPEVAMVGMTEEQAAAAGVDYEIGRAPFSGNAKAKISGLSEGMVKLVFRRADRVVLGVHSVGEMASELIHLGQLVLHEEEPIDRFIHTTFAVPTRSEAYKYAAYDGLMRLERATRASEAAQLAGPATRPR